MSTFTLLLVIGALLFATVNGANDGGTMVAVQLRGGRGRPWVAIIVLALLVAVGPVLLGTRVADTITEGLATFSGPGRDPALAVTMVVSVGLVGALTARGLPTSLFAALIGALTGAAFGLGLHVAWGMVVVVFVAALVTPWIGAVVAWLMTRGQRLLSPEGSARRWLTRRQLGTFVLLCVVYGANGAQLMLALLALALQRSADSVAHSPGLVAVLAACFTVGSVLGLTRLSGSIGNGVIALRPQQVTTTKVASAAAVGGSSLIGLPVSTTQVVTASLLGCGFAEGYRQVRWQHAERIVLGWLLTVPGAFALAAVAGAVWHLIL